MLSGAKHHNKDIIHEDRQDFNAYFRQNVKFLKSIGGQLFFCAEHAQKSLKLQHPALLHPRLYRLTGSPPRNEISEFLCLFFQKEV